MPMVTTWLWNGAKLSATCSLIVMMVPSGAWRRSWRGCWTRAWRGCRDRTTSVITGDKTGKAVVWVQSTRALQIESNARIASRKGTVCGLHNLHSIKIGCDGAAADGCRDQVSGYDLRDIVINRQ